MQYSDKDIGKAILLHEGDSIPGFASFDAFLYLISPLMDEVEEPALDCLNSVYMYLEEISTFIIQKVFVRFPTLAEEVQDIASKTLQEERLKAREVVQNIIEAERGYLFTND